MNISDRSSGLILFLLFGFLCNSAQAERVEHLGCYAEWTENSLTIGNELVERQWQIEPSGLLRPVSFLDKASDTEWLRAKSRQPAPYPDVPPADEKRSLEFGIEKGRLFSVEAESLIFYLTAYGEEQSLSYSFQIFPGSGGITVRFNSEPQYAKKVVVDDSSETAKLSVGLESAAPKETQQTKFSPALDDFLLSPSHLRYTQVELKDQTDGYERL